MVAEAVAAPPKLESMRIVTGCATPEHFVAVFHRFCDAKTCFIPTTETRPVGSRLAFSLRLADGTPVLRGTCVVKQTWKTADNPFKRPGVQLEITKLTADSAVVFEEMIAIKTVVTSVKSNGVVEAAPTETTNQHVPLGKAMGLMFNQGNAVKVALQRSAEEKFENQPTVRVASPSQVLAELDEHQRTVEVPRPAESRAPGSAYVLPANPLTDLDDQALDELFAACTMADDGEAQAIEQDLSIPALPPPPPPNREAIQTLLGFAPLAPARDTQKQEALRKPTDAYPPLAVPVVVGTDGTKPLALPARAPGQSLARFRLHAMTADERMWFLYAIGAALLVAAIVLASAFALG